jgi:hypothetical protein
MPTDRYGIYIDLLFYKKLNLDAPKLMSYFDWQEISKILLLKWLKDD